MDVREPLFLDDRQMLYDIPTYYSDSAGEYIQSFGYDTTKREYLYRLDAKADTGISLEITSTPRGTPLWLGKPGGPYTVYGACETKEDIVAWGGYFEVGYFDANVSFNDSTYNFVGGFLFDRAYHRVYFSDSAKGTGAEDGIVPIYSYTGLQQHDVIIMLAQNERPVGCPVEPPVPFLHQGRISFPVTNETYVMDDYLYVDVTYTDSTKLQPITQKVEGSYEAGKVYLEGTFFQSWPAEWWRYPGTYWDNTISFSWGRGYSVWNGYVTRNSDTITIDHAFGGGEFTRCEVSNTEIINTQQWISQGTSFLSVTQNYSSRSISVSYRVSGTAESIVRMHNAAGKVVRSVSQKDGDNENITVKISTEGMGAGVYFISLISGGSRFAKALIIL